MSTREAPTRGEALSAYVLSALTTLLWVGCVVPAGHVTLPEAGPDAATPVHRQAVLLIPALLLLVTVPVGCTLARRTNGLRAVLAGTDGFVVLYVAGALFAAGIVTDATTLVASLLLLGLTVLSFVELGRQVRPDGARAHQPILAGARLAIALVVLVLPLHILVRPDVERASLLAPFLFVAVSAGGARIARHMRGLRCTAAVLQLLLAAHVLITLRYTMFRSEPAMAGISTAGRLTLGVAAAVVLAALVQLLLLFRPQPAAQDPDPDPGDTGPAPVSAA